MARERTVHPLTVIDNLKILLTAWLLKWLFKWYWIGISISRYSRHDKVVLNHP